MKLTKKEQEKVNEISLKLKQISSFIEENIFNSDQTVEHIFNVLIGLKSIQGNIHNDSSFIATLLAKKYLCAKYTEVDLDATDKAQGAPGLDIDFREINGHRIIGEIKTTFLYKKHDFGANQQDSIMNDLRKLHAESADAKYFFLTEKESFNILKKDKYKDYLNGICLVLLTQAKNCSNMNFVVY